MKPFAYQRASTAAPVTLPDGGMFLAGGTTVVDLMRLEILQPKALVDLGPLAALRAIAATPGGGVMIGALATNTEVAYHPAVTTRYAVLADAILAGASPQIRNVASVGGNLLQRTRCPYYRDLATTACNKRAPGSGCAAIGGVTRGHAIFGVSDHCIAAHPSDMCVGLLALDAIVHVTAPGGATRTVKIADFHTLPGEHPEVESVLAHGELVTAVELPAARGGKRAAYVKARDRAAYEFALASAAVVVETAGGKVASARIALGGVGTKPWRAEAVERALVGGAVAPAAFAKAALALTDADAKTTEDNHFKLELARRTITRALMQAGAEGRSQ